MEETGEPMVELNGNLFQRQTAEDESANQIGNALIRLSLQLAEWGNVPDRRLEEDDKVHELMVQLAEARLETVFEYGAHGYRTTTSSYFASALIKEIVVASRVLSMMCDADDIAQILSVRATEYARRHKRVSIDGDVLVVQIRGCGKDSHRTGLWKEVERWHGLRPGELNYRNSYIELRAEPENIYDANAIKALCRGETFGTLGYVGREFTDDVRRYADEKRKRLKDLVVEVVDPDDFGRGEIAVAIS